MSAGVAAPCGLGVGPDQSHATLSHRSGGARDRGDFGYCPRVTLASRLDVAFMEGPALAALPGQLRRTLLSLLAGAQCFELAFDLVDLFVRTALQIDQFIAGGAYAA